VAANIDRFTVQRSGDLGYGADAQTRQTPDTKRSFPNRVSMSTAQTSLKRLANREPSLSAGPDAPGHRGREHKQQLRTSVREPHS